MYIGIDGCRAGWFVVCLDRRNKYKADIFTDIYTIWKKYSDAKSIFIDIPIGLPGKETINRKCDLEARKILGPGKGASVFPAPCRLSVYARNYRDANYLNRKIIGKGLSYQVWNIIPKIKELDVLITSNSNVKNLIRESHPEVCFWSMAGNVMKNSKKTVDGIRERLRVLKLVCSKSEEIFNYALNKYKRKYLGKDDILDAISMAITASGSIDDLISVPENSQFDSKGIQMEIVYRKWTDINCHA
jgi:predicted RNase H-like nuclease